MVSAEPKSLTNIDVGHIFYRFQKAESYIDNLLSFIKAGLDRNQQILIIDSMRNLPMIIEKIQYIYTAEQHASISLVNNYDYYLSNGDFNTHNIQTHFQKDLSLSKNQNLSIRTWAHVEWVSTEPDTQLLKSFESQSDVLVLSENILSVCAYSVANLSSTLN